ncbi:MAG: DNA repair protein RadA [Rhodospirillales bacterium]|nr:DNA repair protein RadA [Rhodospirillales bacterium]
MARATNVFVCQDCGTAHPKWSGRCDACGAWNTLIEEIGGDSPLAPIGRGPKRRLALVPLAGAVEGPARRSTGIGEFDRVTGGGLVAGSAVLIGGDPGIGKSTLLLQVAAALAQTATVVYISGEEAIDQLRLRADRLGVRNAPVQLAAATMVDDIAATIGNPGAPDVVIIDSIQTLGLGDLDSAPGTVAQVRASAQVLIRLARRHGFVLLLVGHVTKEGMIAGPKVLEHMVDTVLYFEGERGHPFRILRGVKNRFGPTDEIGVFTMTDAGLDEVTNPSALFLAERDHDVSGSAVFAGIEGSRPVLVEIQALIAPSAFAAPRRAVVGWDSARLAMILAVLEARCGMAFATSDVFLNVAGGLRIVEPAADLAVAAALSSAALARPLPPQTVVFGEIGLAGEVRAVARADARLKEAAKLGFEAAIVPLRRGAAPDKSMLHRVETGHVGDLLTLLRQPPEALGTRRSGRG